MRFVHPSSREADVLASTVTMPFVRGTAGGADAYFVVFEASDSLSAAARHATFVPRLAELRGTAAVQRGRWEGDRLVVTAGVDFAPTRAVAKGSEQAFPPATAAPGAVGRAGYSPLVEFPDGSVWNISVIAHGTQWHDRLSAIDEDAGLVRLRMTRGYGAGDTLWYVSTEASDPMVAAIEGATFVPALAAAPAGIGTAALLAFVNGPLLAADARERHGMESAMSGEGDPLNILEAVPGMARYAPLWDLRMAEWTPRAVRDGLRERLLSVEEVANRRESGLVRGMAGAPEPQRSGVLVNCPVVAVR